MGNLALHSAEEPDDLRATTVTVDVPMKRHNDAAVVLGARPVQQHETAARHKFTKFPENQLTTVYAFFLLVFCSFHVHESCYK